MNVFVAFALVALGVALDAWHNHIRRGAERRAHDKGYKQGQREERLRFYNAYDAPMPNCMEQETNNMVQVADEAFMKELNNNGRAVKKVQKTK